MEIKIKSRIKIKNLNPSANKPACASTRKKIFRWHWRREPGKLPPYEIQYSDAN